MSGLWGCLTGLWGLDNDLRTLYDGNGHRIGRFPKWFAIRTQSVQHTIARRVTYRLAVLEQWVSG